MAESAITKKAIAKSLKSLCEEKPFDKISVRDIAERCQINRQTFYYHFNDKYALLGWILDEELFAKPAKELTPGNWTEYLRNVLSTMQSEPVFYTNILHHAGEFPDRHISGAFRTLFRILIRQLDEGKVLPEVAVSFLADFYARGCLGLMREWTDRDMPGTPDQIVREMELLVSHCQEAIRLQNR